MSSSSTDDVLVVGGGLAGLALAGYLARQGREPTVVEQADEWRASGYGIGLWEDGLAVLDELGCLEAARRRAADPDRFEVRATGGEVLTRTAVPTQQTLLLAIYRADLHAALRETVPTDWIRMGAAPARIEEHPDGVTVTFEDGSTEEYGLVVGADGVHSTVREQCFADWRKRELDTYVWSLWASQDTDIGSDMVSVWGPGSEGFVARVGDRIGFNLAARLDAPPSPPGRDELRARAEAIGWRLPAVLDSADEEPFFDRVREVSCESWRTDRVVLVGDAAHAVHPISGMGASLALQDARVLAQELATAGPEGVSDALAQFEARRRPAVTRVQRQARVEAAVTFLESPPLRRLRNAVIRHAPLFELFVKYQASDL
jgi:2-polyprenyl-6-methoxyphenol hydroxylase-like FAD-dependent oxidoreductase